jgi:SNF2 family DNA or RNA helicase
VRLNNLRQLAARGKLPTALAWIADFMESGEPLVVFAEHIAIQKAVLERFSGAAHILGADSTRERQRAVDAFQGEDGPQLIVCSMRAASQGITLTRASNVAFLELDWTPARHDQAEDRLHRIGQDSAVTAWYLLAPETIDETMSELLQRKRGLIDAVTDGQVRDEERLVDAVARELRGRPFRHLRVVA